MKKAAKLLLMGRRAGGSFLSGLGLGGLKQVATRSSILAVGGFNTGATSIMTTSVHTTRDAVTSLRLGFPNWYVDTSDSGKEKGTGGLLTLKIGLEYSGTFTIANLTVPSGFTGLVDITKTIPDNTAFKLHVLQSNPVGVLFTGNASSSFGDRLSFDPTDRTGTGSVPDDNPGYTYAPILILGSTTKRSAIGFSDSRFYGSGDTADSTGDIGIMARGTGPQIAYCNCGVASDRDDWFLANSARRRELAQAFTDVVVGYGVNGVLTVAQRIANVASIYALFPNNRVHGVTTSPHTTGAISQANGSDQTVSQDLTAFNTAVRAKPAPLVSYFDCAFPVSIAATPTKWGITMVKDDSGTFIHENATGAKATIPYVDYGVPKVAGNIYSANQSKLIGWTATRCTLTNAVLAGPDGQTTISTVVEDSSTNTHGIELFFAHTITASVYEYTMLVKRLGTGTARDVQLFLFDGSFGNSVLVGFNLGTGAVNVAAAVNSGTNFSAVYGRIVAVEDGFYRVALGFTSAGSLSNFSTYMFLQSGGGTNYAGNGTGGVYAGQADIRKIT